MRFSLAALPILLTSSATLAQSTPPDLADLVGARAGQAEGALAQRGYAFVRAERGDDRSYTYWWNAGRRQCVTIATMDGRYNSIVATLAPDCRQPTSVRPPVPVSPPAQRPLPGYALDPSFSQAPVNVDGRPVELALVCFGDGTKAGVTSRQGWRWNERRQQYERDNYSQSTTETFETSLILQLWNGGGRIRLPRSLVPPINSRGDNGWWDLQNVSIGPTTIAATYRLNGLNKPRVSVDRRSGRINVQGIANYSFRGTCDEVGRERRRF